MKVLLISNGPVNHSISAGNTFLNIMPDSISLASIYTRNGLPDERVENAFCINEKMILKNIFRNSEKVGKVIGHRDGMKTLSKNDEVNENIIQFAQKKRYTIFFWIQDLIWRTNVWKSRELQKFVEDFNPDIIFTFLINNIFINRIILHVLNFSNKPLVLYAWDNNYQWNKFQVSPLRWINQFFERIYMRKVIKQAKKFYVISDIQKRDYEDIFQRECTVLTKGADFSKPMPLKEKYNNPLQLVYTGNIGNNRWKSLQMLINVIEHINCDNIKVQLTIYTATPLTKDMRRALNIDGCSNVKGSVSAKKIPDIQKKADILVHVEAFDKKNKFAVSQSFSTKIVDYLANAACILAIGPKDIASIDYFIRNDAGLVACNETEIEESLMKIIKNPKLISEYGIKAYDSGKRNHSKETITAMLIHDFNEIIAEEKR